LDDDHCGALELHRKKSPKTIPYFKKKTIGESAQNGSK